MLGCKRCNCSRPIPTCRSNGRWRVLFDAMEAAEPDEPGAKTALIDLKLSPHPQFSDKHGGCKPLETVAASGDQAATQRMAMECRNN
jgi:hypothetical protein